MLVVACVAAPVLPVTPATADSRDEFRILPYLQNPSATEIRVTWFTEDDEPGRLTVHGGRTYDVPGEAQPTLAYTEAERTQEIPGLDQ